MFVYLHSGVLSHLVAEPAQTPTLAQASYRCLKVGMPKFVTHCGYVQVFSLGWVLYYKEILRTSNLLPNNAITVSFKVTISYHWLAALSRCGAWAGRLLFCPVGVTTFQGSGDRHNATRVLEILHSWWVVTVCVLEWVGVGSLASRSFQQTLWWHTHK